MRYDIEGTIVDTTKASNSWDEDTFFNGNNHISRATGSQWTHQTLYRSRKGRYYVEHTSQWQGAHPHAEWISPQEATRWMLMNKHEVPEELQEHVDTVSE